MSSFCSSNIQISYSLIDIVTYVTSCFCLTPQQTECKHFLFDAPLMIILDYKGDLDGADPYSAWSQNTIWWFY